MQVCPRQVCIAQVGLVQVRIMQVGLVQVGVPQVGARPYFVSVHFHNPLELRQLFKMSGFPATLTFLGSARTAARGRHRPAGPPGWPGICQRGAPVRAVHGMIRRVREAGDDIIAGAFARDVAFFYRAPLRRRRTIYRTGAGAAGWPTIAEIFFSAAIFDAPAGTGAAAGWVAILQLSL